MNIITSVIIFSFLFGVLIGTLLTWYLLRIVENDFKKQSKHLS